VSGKTMNELMSVLQNAMNTAGAKKAALLDYENSNQLCSLGYFDENGKEYIVMNTDIFRNQVFAMRESGLNEIIEDSIISTYSENHLVRVLRDQNGSPEAFLYLIIDKKIN
jgi:hypothetical protein